MDFKNALDAMVRGTASVTREMVDKADFDKSYIGVVQNKTTRQGTSMKSYEVRVNGVDHTIRSDLELAVGDYAFVIVPRNDWAGAKLIVSSSAVIAKSVEGLIPAGNVTAEHGIVYFGGTP